MVAWGTGVRKDSPKGRTTGFGEEKKGFRAPGGKRDEKFRANFSDVRIGWGALSLFSKKKNLII